MISNFNETHPIVMACMYEYECSCGWMFVLFSPTREDNCSWVSLCVCVYKKGSCCFSTQQPVATFSECFEWAFFHLGKCGGFGQGCWVISPSSCFLHHAQLNFCGLAFNGTSKSVNLVNVPFPVPGLKVVLIRVIFFLCISKWKCIILYVLYPKYIVNLI